MFLSPLSLSLTPSFGREFVCRAPPHEIGRDKRVHFPRSITGVQPGELLWKLLTVTRKRAGERGRTGGEAKGEEKGNERGDNEGKIYDPGWGRGAAIV